MGNVRVITGPSCKECGRRFDLFDEGDRSEYYYGHDCEGI
jgi:hypothetical protein